MSDEKPVVHEMIDVADIFNIPSHTYDIINLKRDGKVYKLKIQSLTEEEQDEISKHCKEPVAPLVDEIQKDEKGKVIFDGSGQPIKVKRRDTNDPDYLIKYSDFLKKMVEAIAASALITNWDADPEKSKRARLEDKMAILRKKFSGPEIQEIASRARNLSTTSMTDLEAEVKN